MKNMIAMAVGALLLGAGDAYSAQYGSMMNGGNGGMWAGGNWVGGWVGISGIFLMVVAVVGIVILIVREKGKRPHSRRQRRPSWR